MRAAPTDAERKLWWHLKHRLAVPDTHFRRQVGLGPYIVDFASHNARLIIEVDGGQHLKQEEYDAERTAFLAYKGYCVLRFWNNDVLAEIESVLGAIMDALGQDEAEA